MKTSITVFLLICAAALAACGEEEPNSNGSTVTAGDDGGDGGNGGDGDARTAGGTTDTPGDGTRGENEIVVVKPRCSSQADCAVGDNCGASDTCFVCAAGGCVALWEHSARTADNTFTLDVSAEWPRPEEPGAPSYCAAGAEDETCAAVGFRATAYYGPSCAKAVNVVAATGDQLLAAAGSVFSEFPDAVTIGLPTGVELSLEFELFHADVDAQGASAGAAPSRIDHAGEVFAVHCLPYTAAAPGEAAVTVAAADWTLTGTAPGAK